MALKQVIGQQKWKTVSGCPSFLRSMRGEQKVKIIMKMNNKKEERLELGEEKRQTRQRWVETATATEKSTNTIVKHRQKHSFLINTGNNRF